MENPDYSQGYIVKTCSVKETSFAYHGMKKIPQGTHDFRTSFKYVVYSPIAPRNNLFDFIPQDIKHYPILTFEEFKEKILNIKTMTKKTTPHTILLVDARRILKLVSPELKKTLINCWSYDLIEQNYVPVGSQALDWIKNDVLNHPDLKPLLLELFGIGLPDYKEGDLLFVRARNSNIWELRYFAHFNEKGEALCYSVQYRKYHVMDPYPYHVPCPIPLPEIS